MEVESIALGIESQSSQNHHSILAASQNQSSTAEKEAVDVDKDGGRKEMAPRSDVWQHFIKNKDDNVVKIATCKYCRRNMKAESKGHGTSALKRHLNICKHNPHKFNKDPTQATLQVTPDECVGTWRFDQDELRAAFAEMGHKGDDIGKNVMRCLAEWGIERVMTITVDNASANDIGIGYLRRQLSRTNIANELIEEFGAKGKGRKDQASTVASARPTGSNSTKSISQPGTSTS
ncbi:hypothetical protein E2562_017878 [Oryza meyeriana var. granulata]|uniref:BED-type domain-containing protein n=1 Tax=Oryza meyeriana var. granulata TaxID=110450 RepID=A0A6G1DZ88_9ORYZ|nr:hypothetical protein E2562_017878 [Oryza meyeriana var. granulata]